MLSQRGLEAFQAVVELGSVTRAAHALGVSQPAVSRLLRELEARTGLTLFVRRANRLVPTEAGLTLVAEVERSFVGLAAIEAAARRLARGRRRLVVAAMPALATTLLPDLVAGLPADLEVEIEAARVLHAVELVHCGRAALGFVTPLGESAAVETLSRHGFPLSCITVPGHPLATLEVVRRDDLGGCDLVGHASNTATGRALERIFSAMGDPPRIRVRSQLSQVISALVLRGLGAAVVDPFTAKDHVARGGISRPAVLDASFIVSVIAPVASTLDQGAAALHARHLETVKIMGGRPIT